MPGRVVVMSPGGTGEIWMPWEPNFMCTGLVTVAPLLGSRKNTRVFATAFFATGFFAWALAKTPNPATITRIGSTSCLLILISDLLSRSHSSRDGLQTIDES